MNKPSVYAQLYEAIKADTSPYKTYVDTTWTAKILRYELARRYPGTKFSVRLERYSGGSSVDVRWTDGPTWKEIQALADSLEGAGFDGMVDLEYHNNHWLTPQGITFASTPGTEGSRGTVPAESNPAPAGAIQISFMSKYNHAQRDLSDEFLQKVIAKFNKQWGTAYTVYQYHHGMIDRGFPNNHAHFLNEMISTTRG